MQKKILFNFIIDKLPSNLLFILNTVLIYLFFYWTVGQNVELFYPISITLFLFTIASLIEWYRYYAFSLNASKCTEDIYYKLIPRTLEQRGIHKALNAIHHKYQHQIRNTQTESNERDSFIVQWVHNLKAPLTVTGLILEKCQDKESMENSTLESLKKENIRLQEGLQNILTMMRLEEFSKDYLPSTVNLIDSIKKVIVSKRDQFILNDIYPQILSNDESAYVISDEKWNGFLIEQIVSNGIKYSAEPGKKKKLIFKIEKEEEDMRLIICDEGVGIPSYDIDRIFEPFFTGENGRKYKDSSGIGLYICSLISKKLELDIKIKSEVGVGTEVSIHYRAKIFL